MKSNENYFREHYYQEIKPFLEKVSLEGEKEPGYSIDYDDEEDEEDEDTLSQEEAYSLGGCSQTQQKTGKHGDKEKSRG